MGLAGSSSVRGALCRVIAAGVAALSVLTGAGCSGGGPDRELRQYVDQGEFGVARSRLVWLESEQGAGRGTNHLLHELRLGVVNLADGYPDASEEAFNRVFELLRTQGVNENTTLGTVVAGEGVRYWKGEPYEQAVAFYYVGLQKLLIGDWGNARAASYAALQLLDDFDTFRRGGEPVGPPEVPDDGAPYTYAVAGSDFVLAYLVGGVANLAMGRREEARDFFRRAAMIDPAMERIGASLLSGEADTVLVVGYGRGPERVGDAARGVRYASRWPSDRRELRVLIEGALEGTYAPAADFNAMARLYTWDALRNVRAFRQALGESMVISGVILSGARSESTRWAGLGLVIGGALMQATTQPDTRHIELFPQRVYIAPIRLGDEAVGPVTVQVGGDAGSRVVLPVLHPPGDGGLRVQYLRIPPDSSGEGWRSSGRVVYANDLYDGRVEGDELPYILGGRCVRVPTREVLAHYQSHGHLEGWTLSDLVELYREEDIRLPDEEDGLRGRMSRHVLEGGSTLMPPAEGSIGYVRLFTRERPAYQPRSARVRELASEIADKTGGRYSAAHAGAGRESTRERE